MNVNGVPPMGRSPRREKYAIAQDSRGIWYCKLAESWVWRKGLPEDPSHRVSAKVLEYQSDPPKGLMRLNYNTIGASPTTKVISTIPGRGGSWRYGKDASKGNEAEERALREASEKLMQRGFGSRGSK